MSSAMSSVSTTPVSPQQLNTSMLHQLAEAYGIYTHYADAFGTMAVPPNETLTKILAVMGVDTSSDAAVDLALQSRLLQGYKTVLPSAHVVSLSAENSGEEVGVPIHMPLSATTETFGWTLTLESGEVLSGQWQPANPEITADDADTGHTFGKFWLHITEPLPYGYHQLTLSPLAASSQTPTQWHTRLILTPNTCFMPDNHSPKWGLAIQLYAQQSQTNLGMGNLTDLANICQWAGNKGAGMVGINPMHSLFPSRFGHKSPYSPASRLFYSHLYINPKATEEWAQSPEAQAIVEQHAAEIEAARASERVQYETISPVLLATLRALYGTFQAQHLAHATPRAQSYWRFCQERGEELTRFATFLAISQHQDEQAGHTVCWWNWPEGLRSADAADVAAFAQAKADDVAFYQYVQFVLDEQFRVVQQAASQTGMPLGLYGDLAVGSDVSGADVWQNASLYATNVRVGCPPDDCNRLGQDWGLPPMRPDMLTEQGYEPWAKLLRANMRYYGALRIDHAMAMLRLFWIPEGMNGTQGTYVSYPYYDLLGVLALESHRNQCVVIGEDLGTVPPEIFESFPQWNVHSYRLLYFERQGEGEFIPPQQYPPMAMATLTTHDLATLPGFWQSSDIEVRQQLGLYPSDEVYTTIAQSRPHEKEALVKALHQQGLWPTDAVPEAWSIELTEAAYRYLASSPCHLMMCQLEDLVGQVAQVNLPGTVDEHPNWQYKIALPIEEWQSHADVAKVVESIASVRAAQSNVQPANV